MVVSLTDESIFTEINFALGLMIIATLYFILTGILIYLKLKQNRYESSNFNPNDDDYVNASKQRKKPVIFRYIQDDEEKAIVENHFVKNNRIKQTVPVASISPAHQKCHGRFIFELNQLKDIDSGMFDLTTKPTLGMREP